jgi:hypothetical protein
MGRIQFGLYIAIQQTKLCDWLIQNFRGFDWLALKRMLLKDKFLEVLTHRFFKWDASYCDTWNFLLFVKSWLCSLKIRVV